MNRLIPQEDGGLYDLTQWLFDKTEVAIHDYYGLPHNLPLEVVAEGFVGAYLLTRGLQITSKYVVNKGFAYFDELVLPTLEEICQVGIPIMLIAYAVTHPEVLTSNLMDNLGIGAAYLGGFLAAKQDLDKRKETVLEEMLGK